MPNTIFDIQSIDDPWPEDVLNEKERYRIAERALDILQQQGYTREKGYAVTFDFMEAILNAVNQAAVVEWEDALVEAEDYQKVVLQLIREYSNMKKFTLTRHSLKRMLCEIDDCIFSLIDFHGDILDMYSESARTGDPTALLNISSAWIALGQPSQALPALARLQEAEDDRDRYAAHLNRAKLYEEQNRINDSLRELNRALKTVQSEEYYSRANIYLRMAQLQLEESGEIESLALLVKALGEIESCLSCFWLIEATQPIYCIGQAQVSYSGIQTIMQDAIELYQFIVARNTMEYQDLEPIHDKLLRLRRLMASHLQKVLVQD